MKPSCLCLLPLLSALCLPVGASLVVVDNLDLPSPDTTGSQSTYGVQSFTPNIAGIGLSDTVAANLPLPSTVLLKSVEFLRAPAGTAGAGQIFIDLYEGAGNTGTYLGSSVNSIDVNSAAALSSLVWNFPDLSLNSSAEHAFVFSSDAVEGGLLSARLTAANNGGGFVSTYDGGTADNDANNLSPINFDSRFKVTFDAVPEPSSLLLLGLGGLGLFLRRRG